MLPYLSVIRTRLLAASNFAAGAGDAASVAIAPVHGEFVNPRKTRVGPQSVYPEHPGRPVSLVRHRLMLPSVSMRQLLILAIHLLTTMAKLMRSGGVRAVVAES